MLSYITPKLLYTTLLRCTLATHTMCGHSLANYRDISGKLISASVVKGGYKQTTRRGWLFKVGVSKTNEWEWLNTSMARK